ncbi:hypothetical protein RR48_00168 [Papilio machaon]|uniref:Uncharacterized protein n=1 Tax=Papilio machaon TaxID=76193 RepID=A0A0N0PG39_PAPMA|nr:hypothetical protein RR48_00168 [Papilio machaon]
MFLFSRIEKPVYKKEEEKSNEISNLETTQEVEIKEEPMVVDSVEKEVVEQEKTVCFFYLYHKM